MRRDALGAAAALCCLLGTARAAGPERTLTFGNAGFSIAPLDAPPGSRACLAIAMWLPSSGGFGPNVNVMLQPYDGTLDSYVALTRSQFQARGAKVVAVRKTSPTTATFEYTGTVSAASVHWYARVQMARRHAYLCTATATQEQWPSLSARLRACVDSLHTR